MSKPLSHNALDLLLEKVRDTYAFKIVHSKDCDNLAYAISDQCG
ncbi:MAG TPA: hypothetical protein VKY37_04265 [Brumimicrobium sp.]|nr:hypothetical protein [Brumimicrobium sp.]